MSQDKTNLIKALIEFQKECPDIHMDGEVSYKQTKFKYITLKNLIGVVKPLLLRHGLLFTQTIQDTELITTVFHESGEGLCSMHKLPETNNPQDLGKWITYLKRYQLASMLGIVAEDDDDGKISKATIGQIGLIESLVETAQISPALYENISGKISEGMNQQEAAKAIKILKEAQSKNVVRDNGGGSKKELAESVQSAVDRGNT